MKDQSRETSSLKVELLGLLPRVGRVTEVTVSSGLKVLRLLEVEGLDCEWMISVTGTRVSFLERTHQ